MYSALLAVQYVGIAILVFELIFILLQNSSRIQRDLLLLTESLLIVFASYTMEMHCTEMKEALLMAKFGYLGKSFLGLIMLFLVLDYCRIRTSKWLSATLVIVQACFPVIVFTTERHGLFYSSIDFSTDGIFPHLHLGHGPVYLVFMAETVLLCLAMFFICFLQMKKTGSVMEKRQLWLFIAMVSAPLIFLAVFFTDLFQGYDCTLIGYLFSSLGFFFSFLKLNMFDTITLAREQVVDYLQCGLLIYDNHNNVIYHNKQADKLQAAEKAGLLQKAGRRYLLDDRVYSVGEREITKDGNVYGRMYFSLDVTEQHQYELNLEKEKKRADSASKAKSEFLFSMSHDIRTPMNAILGMTKIANLHIDEKEKVEECLKKIEMSGQHLLELINEILDMNKIESGKMELYETPFDIKELMDEVITITTPLAQGMEHEYLTEVDGIVHKAVYGDKSRISQILTNVIGNAVKYTEKGGKIQFSVSENTEKEKENPDLKDHAFFVFQVRDNGIGMSEEYLPYIFDSFTRANEDKIKKIQGTGLGMAITKQFVELMGGEIKVESKLGEGSCFTIEIPLKRQTEEEEQQMAKKAKMEDFSALDFSSKRVLLVEDYEINAEIAGEILRTVGITVEFAVNGKEAVEKVAACEDGYYDLVFMDVMMPVMNGYEATREIRAIDRDYTKQVPIIAMTANAFDEDVKNAMEAGMNGHIAKPFEIDQLMKALNKWLCD